MGQAGRQAGSGACKTNDYQGCVGGSGGQAGSGACKPRHGNTLGSCTLAMQDAAPLHASSSSSLLQQCFCCSAPNPCADWSMAL